MSLSKTPFPSSTGDVVERIADTAQGIVRQTAAKAGPVIDQLRSGAENAVDNLAAKAGQIQKAERKILLRCADDIRSHPFAAIGIAVALGWIVGRVGRMSR